MNVRTIIAFIATLALVMAATVVVSDTDAADYTIPSDGIDYPTVGGKVLLTVGIAKADDALDMEYLVDRSLNT